VTPAGPTIRAVPDDTPTAEPAASGTDHAPSTRNKAAPEASGAHTGANVRRIPEATVARLPVYQRILEGLLRSGTTTVSSEVLASEARVNAAKVRKDLSLLGSFGTRGAGYDAAFLIDQIDRQLGLDRVWPVVIAGIGNLGRALARSEGFAARNFSVAALLDTDPAIIGEMVDGVVVSHPDELLEVAERVPLAIGVITTPAAVAQRVADTMVGAGVRSILNFAPQVLEVPSNVLLRYVDLSIELQVMSFYQSRMADPAAVDHLPIIGSVGVTTNPTR
jgi:redox-sensing transcriptional repressor